MSDLSAGLAVALLAERVGTPEDFVLHLFLGGRYAAVSRVFARLLIFAEAFFQFCYPPIPPADDDVQFVNSLVKISSRSASLTLRCFSSSSVRLFTTSDISVII